jgi:hypothetical protein
MPAPPARLSTAAANSSLVAESVAWGGDQKRLLIVVPNLYSHEESEARMIHW